MKRAFLVGLLLLAAGSAAQAQMSPAQMKWGPAPPGLPPGAKVAVLAGDAGKEGLLTIRIRFPANYPVPPHHHPADEHVTVSRARSRYGMGDKLDAGKLQAMDRAAMRSPRRANEPSTSGAAAAGSCRSPRSDPSRSPTPSRRTIRGRSSAGSRSAAGARQSPPARGPPVAAAIRDSSVAPAMPGSPCGSLIGFRRH